MLNNMISLIHKARFLNRWPFIEVLLVGGNGDGVDLIALLANQLGSREAVERGNKTETQ